MVIWSKVIFQRIHLSSFSVPSIVSFPKNSAVAPVWPSFDFTDTAADRSNQLFQAVFCNWPNCIAGLLTCNVLTRTLGILAGRIKSTRRSDAFCFFTDETMNLRDKKSLSRILAWTFYLFGSWRSLVVSLCPPSLEGDRSIFWVCSMQYLARVRVGYYG